MNAHRFPGVMDARAQGRVLADNGGGAQMPAEALAAMSEFAARQNAQKGGGFARKTHTSETIAAARAAFADLLGVASDTVGFAQNATSAGFSLARCIAHVIRPGDRVVVTDADHMANVAPWAWLQRFGAQIERIPVDRSGDLDEAAYAAALAREPVLVALPWASNATGTIFDVARLAAAAKDAGAIVVADAVQAAPHLRVDVPEHIDALTFSGYKIYAPHFGAWYAAPAFAERFFTTDLAAEIPSGATFWSMETGTQNHEGLAGWIGTHAYLREAGNGSARAAMDMFAAYERDLTADVLARFAQRGDITLYGKPGGSRLPVFAFNLRGVAPAVVAQTLDAAGIEASIGNYYATRLMATLAPETAGSAVRISFAHYSEAEDVHRCFAALDTLAGSAVPVRA